MPLICQSSSKICLSFLVESYQIVALYSNQQPWVNKSPQLQECSIALSYPTICYHFCLFLQKDILFGSERNSIPMSIVALVSQALHSMYCSLKRMGLTHLVNIISFVCMMFSAVLLHVDHRCTSGTFSEPAGMGSGSITFDGKPCQLTLTDLKERIGQNISNSRLNIVGVRRNDRCDGTQISIDSETYCKDDTVTDTLITISNMQVAFAVTSEQTEQFTIKYYKGEFLKLNHCAAHVHYQLQRIICKINHL